MKITVCLLLVTISSCFNLAASNCGKKCSSVCWQSQLNDVTCLQKAMLRNMPATVDAMTNFLCVYDMFKVSENKVEIVRAIRNLQEITGCNLANLLGTGTTLEALYLDANGVLQHLLRVVHDLLINLNIGDYSIPQCGPVKLLLRKVYKILFLYSVPSVNGQSQATIPIDRVSRLLALIQIRAPRLFQPILEVLVGSGVLVRELGLSFRSLTRAVVKTVGAISKRLDETIPMVTDVAGSLFKDIGGIAGSPTGSKGHFSEVTGLLSPVKDSVNGVLHTLGNTVGSVTHSVKGMLDGSDVEILKTATGLIGNLAGSNNGILGAVGGVLGGTKRGPLGDVTDMVPKVFNGVFGTSGSGSNNGPTRIIPNHLWESGNDDSDTFQASGAFARRLDGNVGISASGEVDQDLSSPFSNKGYSGGSMMENGDVNDVEGYISKRGVSTATDSSAYGSTNRLLK